MEYDRSPRILSVAVGLIVVVQIVKGRATIERTSQRRKFAFKKSVGAWAPPIINERPFGVLIKIRVIAEKATALSIASDFDGRQFDSLAKMPMWKNVA